MTYHLFWQLELLPNWTTLAVERFGEAEGPLAPHLEVSETELDWFVPRYRGRLSMLMGLAGSSRDSIVSAYFAFNSLRQPWHTAARYRFHATSLLSPPPPSYTSPHHPQKRSSRRQAPTHAPQQTSPLPNSSSPRPSPPGYLVDPARTHNGTAYLSAPFPRPPHRTHPVPKGGAGPKYGILGSGRSGNAEEGARRPC